MPSFVFFRSVRKKLQFTVFLDHPVPPFNIQDGLSFSLSLVKNTAFFEKVCFQGACRIILGPCPKNFYFWSGVSYLDIVNEK